MVRYLLLKSSWRLSTIPRHLCSVKLATAIHIPDFKIPVVLFTMLRHSSYSCWNSSARCFNFCWWMAITGLHCCNCQPQAKYHWADQGSISTLVYLSGFHSSSSIQNFFTSENVMVLQSCYQEGLQNIHTVWISRRATGENTVIVIHIMVLAKAVGSCQGCSGHSRSWCVWEWLLGIYQYKGPWNKNNLF